MAMSVRRPDGGEDDELVASINTTPLVDIMLVLLIIFLITMPVVTHTVPVALPHEVEPAEQDAAGEHHHRRRQGRRSVLERRAPGRRTRRCSSSSRAAPTTMPQPEVQIRADKDARYEFVGRVVVDCQRAGIAKVDVHHRARPRRGGGAGGGRLSHGDQSAEPRR